MRRDDFVSRASVVVEQISLGFENFDTALREERRRYWLALTDAFDQGVEERAKNHERKRGNPYTAAIGGGLTWIGDIMKKDPKNRWSGHGIGNLGYDISKGTDLVIRVSPKEGILMFEGFEIAELPKGEWGRQDAEGRLLLTPTEFKSRMQELRTYIQGIEEPWPLPVEIRQAATTLLGATGKRN